MMRTTWQSAEPKRQTRLDDLLPHLGSGSLVIRKMTDAERQPNPVRQRPPQAER